MLLNLQDAEGPLHRRIYDALKSVIRAGRLGPGARLPSTRMLAADLNVSRNTVALAYEQLVAEGYVVAHHRSMMCVASAVPAHSLPQLAQVKRKFRPRLSIYGRHLTENPAMPPSVPTPTGLASATTFVTVSPPSMNSRASCGGSCSRHGCSEVRPAPLATDLLPDMDRCERR